MEKMTETLNDDWPLDEMVLGVVVKTDSFWQCMKANKRNKPQKM